MKLRPASTSYIYVQVRSEADRTTFWAAKVPEKDNGLEEFQNVDDLVRKFGKSRMVILHFLGFGVLARLVSNSPGYKDQLIVTGDTTDFLFNTAETNTQALVAFIRRSVTDPVIEAFIKNKVAIRQVYIGPSLLACVHTMAMLPPVDYTLTMAGGKWTGLERNEVPNLHNYLAYDLLLPLNSDGFAGALDDVEVNRQVQSHKEFMRFKRLGIAILTGFLLALTANYFYVNHLYQDIADLEAEVAEYGDNLSHIERLEQEKARKISLIENSGIRTQYPISYFLDEIGKSTPPSLSLESLETFPLTEALKPKRKVEVDLHRILITGWTPNSVLVDDWMETLDAYNWTQSVELINYVREVDNRAHFQLAIYLKE